MARRPIYHNCVIDPLPVPLYLMVMPFSGEKTKLSLFNTYYPFLILNTSIKILILYLFALVLQAHHLIGVVGTNTRFDLRVRLDTCILRIDCLLARLLNNTNLCPILQYRSEWNNGSDYSFARQRGKNNNALLI